MLEEIKRMGRNQDWVKFCFTENLRIFPNSPVANSVKQLLADPTERGGRHEMPKNPNLDAAGPPVGEI